MKAARRAPDVGADRAGHAVVIVVQPRILPGRRVVEVVALIAGLVWALPVWQFVSETTQEWMLPSAEQAS